jgi:hypothetical protein
MPLTRKRPLLLLTWKTKVNDQGEKKHLYSTYDLLMEQLPGYNIHTIKYHLVHKKTKFEDRMIKIEKVKIN